MLEKVFSSHESVEMHHEYLCNHIQSLAVKFYLSLIEGNTVKTGSAYPYLKELENRLQSVHYEYALFKDPVNIVETMSKSDLALISFIILLIFVSYHFKF